MADLADLDDRASWRVGRWQCSACRSRFHRALRRIGVHSRPADVHAESKLGVAAVRARSVSTHRDLPRTAMRFTSRRSLGVHIWLSVPCGPPKVPQAFKPLTALDWKCPL